MSFHGYDTVSSNTLFDCLPSQCNGQMSLSDYWRSEKKNVFSLPNPFELCQFFNLFHIN